jgi:hypothetical protein
MPGTKKGYRRLLFLSPMLKLYKPINGELHYWEAWDTGDESYIIHCGKVGDAE